MIDIVIGLDVHKHSVYATVLNDNGERVIQRNMERAIELYGKLEEIITDNGTQFLSSGKNGIPWDKNKFQ